VEGVSHAMHICCVFIPFIFLLYDQCIPCNLRSNANGCDKVDAKSGSALMDFMRMLCIWWNCCTCCRFGLRCHVSANGGDVIHVDSQCSRYASVNVASRLVPILRYGFDGCCCCCSASGIGMVCSMCSCTHDFACKAN